MGCTQGRLKLQPAASIHSASQSNERYCPALPRRESLQSGSATVLCSSPKINNPFAGTKRCTGGRGLIITPHAGFHINIFKRDQIFSVSDELVLVLVTLVFLFTPPILWNPARKGEAAQRQNWMLRQHHKCMIVYACSVKSGSSCFDDAYKAASSCSEERSGDPHPVHRRCSGTSLGFSFFSLSLSFFWGFPCFYCTSIQPIPSTVHPSLPMLEGKLYRSKCKTENYKISTLWFCCLYCPDPSPALLAQWTVMWIQRSFCACGIFPCGPSHTAANMFCLLWATFMFYFTFYIG